MMKSKLLLIVLLPFVVILSGCGRKSPPQIVTKRSIMYRNNTMSTMRSVKGESDFIATMIRHHQEAVNTSKIIVASTQNEPLKTIAQGIVSGQSEEIATLQKWVTAFQIDTGTTLYENMMPNLTSLSGQYLDKSYIIGMIDHHKGAIAMAQNALQFTLHPEVKAFAENVIKVQSDEIIKFQDILKNYK